MDPLETFKQAQKEGWAHFAPLEMATTMPAFRLVKYGGIRAGQRVLDVACGTGVVALTAAGTGAQVTGLDLTPELLERARVNSRVAQIEIDWREGDAEALPFKDETFDVVVSQFGHMFAPRPEVAVAEMLRVLNPGGTIAFSTWPPELYIGRMIALCGRFMPAPPPGVSSPVLWGDPNIVRERLGAKARDITFDRDTLLAPALSLKNYRNAIEQTAAPVIKLVQSLTTGDPAKLASFRAELEALTAEYFGENAVRQGYLLTRATKN